MSKIEICFLTLTLWMPIALLGQEATQPECMPLRDISMEEISFQDGEQLTFVANYNWGIVRTEVGELTTKVRFVDEGRTPYFEALASIRTYSFFDVFFKIRDTYEARFRARNLSPLYFYRDIHEGKYTIQNRFNFVEGHKVDATITRSNNRVKDTIMQGKSCTFDLMSLLYFARNIDVESMEVGEQVSLSFVIDEEIHDLFFRFLGIENKKVPGLGTFRCRKYAATLVAGVVFTGKEEMQIWISDDSNRLPIWLETPIVVGKVSARISKYEGIKFPLTSKIK